jgi:hypothetical protein
MNMSKMNRNYCHGDGPESLATLRVRFALLMYASYRMVYLVLLMMINRLDGLLLANIIGRGNLLDAG